MVLMSLRAREWITWSETRNGILVERPVPSSHCYGIESARTGGRKGIRSGPGAMDPLDRESPMHHSLWCIAFHPLLAS